MNSLTQKTYVIKGAIPYVIRHIIGNQILAKGVSVEGTESEHITPFYDLFELEEFDYWTQDLESLKHAVHKAQKDRDDQWKRDELIEALKKEDEGYSDEYFDDFSLNELEDFASDYEEKLIKKLKKKDQKLLAEHLEADKSLEEISLSGLRNMLDRIEEDEKVRASEEYQEILDDLELDGIFDETEYNDLDSEFFGMSPFKGTPQAVEDEETEEEKERRHAELQKEIEEEWRREREQDEKEDDGEVYLFWKEGGFVPFKLISIIGTKCLVTDFPNPNHHVYTTGDRKGEWRTEDEELKKFYNPESNRVMDISEFSEWTGSLKQAKEKAASRYMSYIDDLAYSHYIDQETKYGDY